jgi:hypothetical protein
MQDWFYLDRNDQEMIIQKEFDEQDREEDTSSDNKDCDMAPRTYWKF